MFVELLSNSEEKIFLEAIDQFFPASKDEKEKEQKGNSFEKKDNLFFNETELEADLENLNVKFCESLDEMEDDKDASTELDSEESCNGDVTTKKVLLTSDIFSFDQKSIISLKEQSFKYYKDQIDLVNKIKAIFNDNNVKKSDSKDSQEN